MEINLLIPSIALGTQLVSIYFAIRLLRYAEKRVVAIVFILAVSLMAVRRWISLERIISQGDIKIDWFAETVALSISLLVLYGIVSIARIFKSEEENKNAAASAEMRYRTLFDQSPDGVLLINTNGDIVDFNNKVNRQLGYTREEFSKLRISDIDPVENQDDVKARIEKVLKSGRAEFEVKHKTKQGDMRDVLVIVQTLELSGQSILHTIWRDVTERRRTEEELKVSEERFRLAMQGANDGLWDWDLRTDKVYYSPRWKSMLGYADDELEGHLDTWKSLVHPDDIEPTLSLVRDFLEKRSDKFEMDFRMRHKDGHYVNILSRAFLLDSAQGLPIRLVGTHVDITERKKAEEELKRNEIFIKSILESVDEGFVVIGRDYRIISANKAYCDNAGITMESAIGKYCHEVSHHSETPCFEGGEQCPVKYTFETGEHAEYLHTHYDKHGNPSFVETKSYPMRDDAGKMTSAIEILIDVTEKKKLEDQYRHAQKMEAIGQLAGGVAHDFNNILSAIIGYGHLSLMKLRDDDPVRHYIDQILQSSERAAALTQGLLAFSRKRPMKKELNELNAVIKDFEKFLHRLLRENIEMKIRYSDEQPVIMADRGQIEQVIMNLVANARDAIPNNGRLTIDISVSDMDEAFIRAHDYGKVGHYAVLSVSDTGVGMNEETQKRIFEPFFTTKEVGKGTGLGLATAYGIVKAHDGFINVYSKPRKGTTFHVYFPLVRTTNAVPESKERNPVPPKGGSETILLAEDDASLRTMTSVVLRDMGYTVIDAEDGSRAVARFNENRAEIKLVILDAVMPKMNGLEAYQEISNLSPKVRCIFMSGYAGELFAKDGLPAGTEFLSKPVKPSELLTKVREVLDRE